MASFALINPCMRRNTSAAHTDREKGSYKGTLDEVKANVAQYGHIEVCRFVKGWFDDTLPHFKEPIAAIYLDVAVPPDFVGVVAGIR